MRDATPTVRRLGKNDGFDIHAHSQAHCSARQGAGGKMKAGRSKGFRPNCHLSASQTVRGQLHPVPAAPDGGQPGSVADDTRA